MKVTAEADTATDGLSLPDLLELEGVDTAAPKGPKAGAELDKNGGGFGLLDSVTGILNRAAPAELKLTLLVC